MGMGITTLIYMYNLRVTGTTHIRCQQSLSPWPWLWGQVGGYTQIKQGITGDNPLTQDFLVWANTELRNFMMYNSYMNEEKTKSLWP